MSEFYQKSKEEIALELLRLLLAMPHSREGTINNSLKNEFRSVEEYIDWICKIYIRCLSTINGGKK